MHALNRLARHHSSGSFASLLKRKVSTTSAGGVNVLGFENKGPSATSSLTVAIKAGSRYETTPGVAHVLKSFAYKATASASALRTAREAELYGGILSASLGREHLLLSAEFLRGDEEHFLNVLASVLSSSQYYQHELKELVLPVVELESLAASTSPSVVAFDLAHAIAFRRGLGNSLPTSPLLELSAYFGGEARAALDIHAPATSTPTVILAYGTSSPATADLKVLKHLLGGETSVKWTPGVSPLSKAADKLPGASAKAFLLPYSDAALFGVILSAPTSAQTKILAQEVASIIKNAGAEFKEDEVKRAVAKATFEDATSTETLTGLVNAVAPAALAGSAIKATSFSGVSTSSVAKAAANLLKSKPTVVGVGNLSVLPYADELGL
ncbi:uncharacterized protein L203_102754 [Cryptococcus depauperatus CBS 7841]|uniref:Cytochrome b-c1 complex subunit 2, mitochondrial n=1 Tax=Cryptococcus depauperatus CBS 7841 TaxID=1295531 RepID=A0AAJ8M1E3_9TREE